MLAAGVAAASGACAYGPHFELDYGAFIDFDEGHHLMMSLGSDIHGSSLGDNVRRLSVDVRAERESRPPSHA